ncbi:MAG: radical SAM protein, partial [Thermodesulfobacteriota bacterium]
LWPEGRLESFLPLKEGLPEKIKPARAEVLPRPALATTVLTPKTEFAQTRLVEIGRGCPHGCRFCLAGFVYRPPRTAAREAVFEALGPPAREGERVGLVSPAAADHPELEEIVRTLTAQGRQVTVSSLRVQALTPSLVEALALGRLQSVALAPEASSQRLRDAINKNLTEARMLEGVGLLGQAGLRRLKLYFMIGLPLEEDDDLRAAADLVQKIRARFTGRTGLRRRAPEITVSVSSFVPKPHTPFQAAPSARPRELKRRLGLFSRGLTGHGVKVNFDPPRLSYFQTLFSRGDRRLAGVIEALADGLGPAQALARAPYDPDDLVHRALAEDRARPWDFIDHGLSPGFLEKEAKRASAGRSTPPCRPETCRLCGVCGREEP